MGTFRTLPTLLASLLAGCASVADGSASSEPSAPKTDYHLYVATESDDFVHHVRFDATTRRLERVARIEVGYQAVEIEGPHGLAVSNDGEHWFVTIAHGKPYGLLYKYTTGGNELVGQCELGLFPATMQVSPATGLLYAVNFDLHGDMTPSSVSVVDPDEMIEVARTTTGPMPHGSRLSRDGLVHYSCAMMSGDLYEIDALSFEVRRVLRLTEEGTGERRDPPAPPSPDDPSPVSAGVPHGSGGNHTAPPVDGSSAPDGAPAAPVAHGSGTKPTWVYPHPTLPRVYVALNGAAQVVEVDTATWEITRRFPTAKGPYNVEVSPDGRLLVVTYKGAQSIGVFDVESGAELARLPSSRPVTHGVVISDDSRFAFVSCESIGADPGTVDVVDLESLEVVDSLELGLQAGGIYFWKSL